MIRIPAIFSETKERRPWVTPMLGIGLVMLIGLSILQDFMFSEIKNTGFYVSESLLYNSLWLYVIPLGGLLRKTISRITIASKRLQWSAYFGVVVGITLVHLLLFTVVFVGISWLLYTPTHRFSGIFNTILTHQSALLLVVYGIVVVVQKKKDAMALFGPTKEPISRVLKLKQGTKIRTVPIAQICCITTDKPYSALHTLKKKHLDRRSLKEFETLLPSEKFVRIHRASLVNTDSVCELRSRKNGDYDVLLKNGMELRMSRHYRSHWEQLLHSD
ncbi:LytR/AlgR family response regulator transcription factor [Altibacter sp. HG106]|uniref:LytR/AlgR family response regulator transcription factor n=1 Tax=Altibacter sp. HG106 TaxID=3023937 RepID=UPI00234FE563|nr:LytTR family DNA-binding domain-containing protein [Altibacter sp. HG106]MDC7995669.1 LytTR family DNA-binding domain-containing protein [Altibacter sp. HG106]